MFKKSLVLLVASCFMGNTAFALSDISEIEVRAKIIEAHAKNKASHKVSKKTTVSPSLIKKINSNLSESFPLPPGASIMVSPSVYDGMYEVAVGNQYAYTDKNAEYLLIGHIIHLKTKKDITQEKMDAQKELRHIDFSSLPLDKAIKFVKGDGSRVFAIFTDPDCPYCKKFNAELKGLDNYTMYVFLYPVISLHPNAENASADILCSTDPVKAFNDYESGLAITANEPLVQSGVIAVNKNKDCLLQVKDLVTIGQNFNIEGTPTLIRSDGVILTGGMPADRFNVWLSKSKPVSTSH